MNERRVEVTYDPEADAAYVYLQARDGNRKVATNRLCKIELDMEMAAITVDFDAEGRIAGFELLGASRLLPRALLQD